MLCRWLKTATRTTACQAAAYATRKPAAPATAQPAAASPPGSGAAVSAPQGSIPTTCCVTIAEVAPGMRGLQATRSVQEGETLLSLPRTHVLTVWDSLHLKARRHSWCKYTLAFQQQWQVKMPPALLEVLSDSKSLHRCMRMAVLLLWVRRHVSAPFWQQWVQQLPGLEECTAAGPAWSPEAIRQLQWPYLQEHMERASSMRGDAVEQLQQLLKTPGLRRLDLIRGGRATKLAHWAVQIASTRTHSDAAGRLLLVPYDDMANHSSAAVAGFGTSPSKVKLVALESIEAGQEVTLCYVTTPTSDRLMKFWGFVERGTPFDWPYPIQRPLQLLPRLPWDVVLAAAGRLYDVVHLGPEEWQQQQHQQQEVLISAGDALSLMDGEGLNRILAAASSLPVEADAVLDILDFVQPPDIQRLVKDMERRRQPQGPQVSSSWLQLPAEVQEPLWKQPARVHIMDFISDKIQARNKQPAPPTGTAAAVVAVAAAVIRPGTPQQRWQAALGELTARLLGLHARLGLLAMPTTLEEDVAIERAALAGAFADWTPWRIGRLLGWHGEGDSAQQPAVEALLEEVLVHTWNVARLVGSHHTSISSRAQRKQLQAGAADLQARLQGLTQQMAQSPRRRVRIARLQQLAQHAAGGTAVAGAGMDACLLRAVQARLQQKMLLQVYGLLCDAVAAELKAQLG